MKRLYECVKMVVLGFIAISLLFSMPVLIVIQAFPKDLVVEAEMEFVNERIPKWQELFEKWEQQK